MRLKALTILLAILVAATGCATHLVPPGPAIEAPRETQDTFVMPDGMRLPYRTWLPDGEPVAVVLALHGMNDSRDAWEYPGPELAAHGIAVFCARPTRFRRHRGPRLLAWHPGAGGRRARDGGAAASPLPRTPD